ncbi:uncharacterized protein LOC143283420 isoform X2 [Babylonia areolata]|uniref:uncharacterized protein LOC143283420 isoform X2 n=1 Tax=Babylonia areolata TaxID=304850 RepID=UPI003FCF0282
MFPQPSASSHSVTWRQFVTLTYPDVLQATYCVPPLHFNRVPYQRVVVPGLPADLPALVKQTPADDSTGKSAVTGQGLIPRTMKCPSAQPPTRDYSLWPTDPPTTSATVLSSDMRDDFCQQYLLYNLHALAKHVQQVMFVLSSVNFQNYLSGAAVSSAMSFPRPTDLKRGSRGDFDFLIVHRHRGLLVAELKSVGMQRSQLQLSQEQADHSVTGRLDRAVSQLEKGRRMASHLVSDVAPGLPVRTVLFLPFVSRRQVLRVLTATPALAQRVRGCLGVNTTLEAADLTLCSDDLSDPADPWNVPAHVLSRLTSWWQRRMTSCPGPALTDGDYLEIIGRFVGPATTVSVHCSATPRLTVEVRTQGEAVAELGSRLARLVLTPEQTDLLTRAPPLVYLSGPPGTGKTVMLVLMALIWCRRGWNVQVVSAGDFSLAASLLVCHQIRKTLDSTAAPGAGVTSGDVLFRSYEFCKGTHPENETSVETAVQEMVRASPGQPVCVVMDETNITTGEKDLVDRLLQADPNLHLWAANIKKTRSVAELQTERMTRPLRSAPCVVREIQRAVESRHYETEVEPYSTDAVPSPADGFSPTVVRHQGPKHTTWEPISCHQCGVDVAAALRDLGVGDTARRVPKSSKPLQFRDVLIVMHLSGENKDDIYDPTGKLLSPASPFVRGLRAKGVPVCVVDYPTFTESTLDEARWKKHHSKGCRVPVEEVEDAESLEESQKWEDQRQLVLTQWKTKMEDMATSRHDHVIVTPDWFVQGLERKVVVAVMTSVTELKHLDRMKSVSRCTTHLIIVQE